MTKNLRITSNIRKPFLIYDFATACSLLNFLTYEENFVFFFISVERRIYMFFPKFCKFLSIVMISYFIYTS
jgi:hypothetical protein